ncbi:hypothetical protein Tco_0631854 [Tanacetum coccineum]
MPSVTMPAKKPKVLAPGMYAIDVEPITHRNRNNREVHLDYLKHLKESVETLREIELLEYVIETCLKDFNKRDRKIATTPLIRKKKVTFVEPCETSTHNTQTHVEEQKMKKTNEPGIRFIGVKVLAEVLKEHITTSRPIKALTMYPTNTPTTLIPRVFPTKSQVKINIFALIQLRVKQVKQVWQATGKLFTNVGYQWKPTDMKFTLGEQCPLTRFIKSKVVTVKQPENVSTSNIVITERLSNTSQKPLTRYQRKNKLEKAISTVTPITAVPQSINDSVKPTVCANQ